MKILRKIRKNSKALSPVVASIILIAVTVAVSIAVAAWMGALTVGFMDTSTVTISAVSFDETVLDAQDLMTLTVKNTGTGSAIIATAKVNGALAAVTDSPVTILAGDPGSLELTADWVAGNNYKIDLYDANGQLIGSYQTVAA
jgi:flagellin-like protein